MGRIHVLDDAVINKIAAGEVVERPASVVKELVENAIDAGATRVEVALEHGGTRLVAVTDDGVGMSAEDARLALRRHATSKIRTADDLFHVETMGFRGEALASIASVSRFALSTTQRGASEGVRLQLEGEGEPLVLPWSGPAGTTIAVESLFFNLPVRAKFLKAPATELSHCLELMQAFALCHPRVGFVLTHNGRDQFRVAPVTGDGEAAFRERARQVLPKDAAEALVYVASESRYGNVEALVSPPGVEKPTGKFIYTFVNGRWVKDKTVRYGIMRGYHSHLLKGRFPIAVLHVTMDPTLVDVNVHPAKTELRFQYAGELQNVIATAIREKLRDATWAAPAGGLEGFGIPAAPAAERAATVHPSAPRAASGPAVDLPRGARIPFVEDDEPGAGAGRRAYPQPSYASRAVTSTTRSFRGASATGEPALPASHALAPPPALFSADDIDAFVDGRDLLQKADSLVIPWDELQFIGAFDRCYLFFAHGDRMLVLDQHAFHERVLYERLTRNDGLLGQAQPLLVPESLELSPTEVATLRARRHLLQPRGFDFDVDGETTITVKSVPSLLAGRDLNDLYAGLAGGVDAPSNEELLHHILSTAACHAAVRAGEDLGEGELKQLLAEARTVDFYHNCPHGRRVFRWWSKGQVAAWFDR